MVASGLKLSIEAWKEGDAQVSAQILSLQLRPATLDELFGAKRLVAAIRKQVAKRPPQSWLFYGPSGCGKTTIARIIALSYQCQHQKEWGAPCSDCWKRWDQYAIHELNASERNKTEDARQLVELSRHRPITASHRVFILDEAHRLTADAVNVLLKPIEEPPASTVWIICTTAPNKLPVTLRRRCMSYPLNPLSLSNVETFLKRACRLKGIKVPDVDTLIDRVHAAGVNSPAMLLMVLEKIASGTSIALAVSGLSEESPTTLAICKTMVEGDWHTLRELLDKTAVEESRLLQASIAGYLRGMLLRENDPKRCNLVARSLLEITSESPIDDATLRLWLTANLYRICETMKQ